MSDKENAFEKMENGSLSSLMGKIPSKEVFISALEKVKEEKDEANEKKAVELIKKALELKAKRDEICKQFKSQEKKIGKELNKLLNAIEAMANGKTAPTNEENEDKPEE